jgi:hypothetical protein
MGGSAVLQFSFVIPIIAAAEPLDALGDFPPTVSLFP